MQRMRLDKCRDCLWIGCNHPFALDLSCPINNADRCQPQRYDSTGNQLSRSRRGPHLMCAKPRLPWPESLRSFCTGCGSKAASSSGHQRRLLISLHSRTTEFPPTAGANVPAGTLGLMRSLWSCDARESKNALHTLPPASISRHLAEGTPLRRREPCTRQGCSQRA